MRTRTLTRLTLRLWPLTPIHIGNGEEYYPDSYFLLNNDLDKDERTLVLFDPLQVVRHMNGNERAQFRSSQWKEISGALRQCAKRLALTNDAEVPMQRIPVSHSAWSDLNESLRNANRTGEIIPFIRSGGKPYIPGSSIKGAFRTALVSACLPRGVNPKSHEEAMRLALGIDEKDTTTDPLRFLSVSDAILPEGITLIDRAEIFRPSAASSGHGGGLKESIRMNYERTRCLLETNKNLGFDVTLTIDSRAAERTLKCKFDEKSLIGLVLDFHEKILFKERKIFFSSQSHNKIYGLYTGLLNKTQKRENFVLLRIGRFGHFESKSLEGVRRGHFPQRKFQTEGSPDEWGTTRTVVKINESSAPFGWVVGYVDKVNRTEL